MQIMFNSIQKTAAKSDKSVYLGWQAVYFSMPCINTIHGHIENRHENGASF